MQRKFILLHLDRDINFGIFYIFLVIRIRMWFSLLGTYLATLCRHLLLLLFRLHRSELGKDFLGHQNWTLVIIIISSLLLDI